MASDLRVASMASTASPSDTPSGRLKDTVAAGNCPWRDRPPAAGRSSMRTAAQRHLPAAADSTCSCEIASGPCWNCGCASSTTRYWLDCVKMVEMRRWPKALYSAVVDVGDRHAEAAGGGAIDLT
jgi:hypothetical protein